MEKDRNTRQKFDGIADYSEAELKIVKRVIIASILFLIGLMLIIAFCSCVQQAEKGDCITSTAIILENRKSSEKESVATVTALSSDEDYRMIPDLIIRRLHPSEYHLSAPDTVRSAEIKSKRGDISWTTTTNYDNEKQ